MTAQGSEAVGEAGQENKGWVGGKYKTPEDLENGYVSKDREYTKLANEHSDLKKRYDSVATVPSDYSLPEGLDLPAVEIAQIKQMAKTASLSQQHFEGIVREANTERRNHVDKLEKTKKALGEDKVNVLSDYVKKYYPEPLHQTIFNHLLTDEQARSAAMSDRDNKLNNRMAGMGQGTTSMPEKYEGQRDLQDMAKKFMKNPRDHKLREKMIDVARQVGEERFK